MEPQIFPKISGDVIASRDVEWISAEKGKGRVHWARLGRDGEIAKELTLPLQNAVDCKSVVATGDGGSVWFGLEWNFQAECRMLLSALDANGNTLWSHPYGQWREFSELEWLASARLPDNRLVALCRIEGVLALQAFTASGEPAWKVPMGQHFGQTLGVVGQQLLVATSPNEDGRDLAVEAFDFEGKALWSFRPGFASVTRVGKIVDAGEETVLVGGLKQGERWRGFAGVFRGRGDGWRVRVLEVMPDLGLQDAMWRDGQLWVGGELTRDYETDVFWGRLK
jgi:hypothetical protein